jgi:RHS repeat-associated protein
LQFNGQYTDAESGLIYLRARYYDPATGQFLSVDPLAARTRARYTYAAENPLSNTDPSGLDWIDTLGGSLVGAADNASLGIGPKLRETLGIEYKASSQTAYNAGAGVFIAASMLDGVGEAALTARAAAALDDELVLVRGGTNTVERFLKGSGVTTDTAGNLSGVSVNSGRSVEEAAQGIKNGQIGVTTVGRVRSAGGEVVRDPTAYNPGHCLINGCSAQTLSELFTPTIKNPWK